MHASTPLHKRPVPYSLGWLQQVLPMTEKRLKKDYKYLPSTLPQIYQEICIAYNNRAFILCAAVMRLRRRLAQANRKQMEGRT